MAEMPPRPANRFPDAVVALLALTWMGLLIGVSFLATPVKFQAPSLDLPVALEVGRVTFAAFSRVEWCLSLLLGIAVLCARAWRTGIMITAITIMIVALQTFWLLPVLDLRIEAVIAGRSMPPSMHHMFYAGMEGCKTVGLAILGPMALYRVGWRERSETGAANP